MIRSIKDIKECPDCGSEKLTYKEEESQVVCRECGLIYEPLTPKEEEKFEITHKLKK